MILKILKCDKCGAEVNCVHDGYEMVIQIGKPGNCIENPIVMRRDLCAKCRNKVLDFLDAEEQNA